MRQSQPFHQLFTIALSGPGQAGPEVLTREERLEYDALPYDVQRRRDWLAGRLAAKGAAANAFSTPAWTTSPYGPRTAQPPRRLIAIAGTRRPLQPPSTRRPTQGLEPPAIASRRA